MLTIVEYRDDSYPLSTFIAWRVLNDDDGNIVVTFASFDDAIAFVRCFYIGWTPNTAL